MQPSSREPIQVGPIMISFLVDASDSGGSVTMFECDVPADARVPAPHSHDGFEETIYGLEGVSTFSIDGDTLEIGPGDFVCIPRGAVHGFANHSGARTRFLAAATPGVFGPAYFRELSEVLARAGAGPPDRAAMLEVMSRHGLTPARPAS